MLTAPSLVVLACFRALAGLVEIGSRLTQLGAKFLRCRLVDANPGVELPVGNRSQGFIYAVEHHHDIFLVELDSEARVVCIACVSPYQSISIKYS